VSNSSISRSVRTEPQQFDLLDAPDSAAELRPREWRVRIHPRARNLSLHVEPNGAVRVTVPPRSRPAEVEAFVSENADWIARAQHYYARRRAAEPLLPARIALRALGTEVRVRYQVGSQAGCRSVTDELRVRSPRLDPESCWPLLRGWLKRSAKDYLNKQINRLSYELQLQPKRVQVRLQKSRWGSCSSTGTVSLNAALLLRPPAEVRYVLVHELCHLRHMNHSRRYWALVERHEPDYRALDRALNAAWRDTPAWVGG
jgi:predicted metal-dependent hydrolase